MFHLALSRSLLSFPFSFRFDFAHFHQIIFLVLQSALLDWSLLWCGYQSNFFWFPSLSLLVFLVFLVDLSLPAPFSSTIIFILIFIILAGLLGWIASSMRPSIKSFMIRLCKAAFLLSCPLSLSSFLFLLRELLCFRDGSLSETTPTLLLLTSRKQEEEEEAS